MPRKGSAEAEPSVVLAKTLEEMGFDFDQAMEAARRSNNDMEAAIEWLEAEAAIAGKSSAKPTPTTEGSDKSASNAPDPALASNLAAMGFAYDDALHALRETSNDVDAAVQRLAERQKAKEEQGETSSDDSDNSKRSLDADKAPEAMDETKEGEKKNEPEKEAAPENAKLPGNGETEAQKHVQQSGNERMEPVVVSNDTPGNEDVLKVEVEVEDLDKDKEKAKDSEEDADQDSDAAESAASDEAGAVPEPEPMDTTVAFDYDSDDGMARTWSADIGSRRLGREGVAEGGNDGNRDDDKGASPGADTREKATKGSAIALSTLKRHRDTVGAPRCCIVIACVDESAYGVAAQHARAAVSSMLFRRVVASVIVIGMALVALQTYPTIDPSRVAGSTATAPLWFEVAKSVVLTVLAIEVLFKLLADRSPWLQLALLSAAGAVPCGLAGEWGGLGALLAVSGCAASAVAAAAGSLAVAAELEWLWSSFDALVTLFSFPVFAGVNTFPLLSLRALRFARLSPDLLRRSRHLRLVYIGIAELLASAPAAIAALFALLFCFGAVGVFAFREHDPFRFGDLPSAMLTLLRFCLFDDAAEAIYHNRVGCRVAATGGSTYRGGSRGAYDAYDNYNTSAAGLGSSAPTATTDADGFVRFTAGWSAAQSGAGVGFGLQVGVGFYAASCPTSAGSAAAPVVPDQTWVAAVVLLPFALFGSAIVFSLVLAPVVYAMRSSSAIVLREVEHEEAFWRTRRGAVLARDGGVSTTAADPLGLTARLGATVRGGNRHRRLSLGDGTWFGGRMKGKSKGSRKVAPQRQRDGTNTPGMRTATTITADVGKGDAVASTSMHPNRTDAKTPSTLTRKATTVGALAFIAIVAFAACDPAASTHGGTLFATSTNSTSAPWLLWVTVGIAFVSILDALSARSWRHPLGCFELISATLSLALGGYALSRWLMHKFGSASSLGFGHDGAGWLRAAAASLLPSSLTRVITRGPHLAFWGQRVRTQAALLGIGEVMFAARFVLLYIVLVLFIFGAAGVSLFGRNDPVRFGSLHEASLTLALMLCSKRGGGWTMALLTNMFGCNIVGYESVPELCTAPAGWGWWALAYFVPLALLAHVATLSLLLALATVMLESTRGRFYAAAKIEVALERIKREQQRQADQSEFGGGSVAGNSVDAQGDRVKLFDTQALDVSAQAALHYDLGLNVRVPLTVTGKATVEATDVVGSNSPVGSEGNDVTDVQDPQRRGHEQQWRTALLREIRRPLHERDVIAYRRCFDAMNLDNDTELNVTGVETEDEELVQRPRTSDDDNSSIEQDASRKLGFRPGGWQAADPFHPLNAARNSDAASSSEPTCLRIGGIELTLSSGGGAGAVTLSRAELEVALLGIRKLRQFPSPSEVEYLFRCINTDGSGAVSFLQFLELMSTSRRLWEEQYVDAVVRRLLNTYDEAQSARRSSVSVGKGAIGALFDSGGGSSGEQKVVSAAAVAQAQAASLNAGHDDVEHKLEEALKVELEHARYQRTDEGALTDDIVQQQFECWTVHMLCEYRQLQLWTRERQNFLRWMTTGSLIEARLKEQLTHEVSERAAEKAEADHAVGEVHAELQRARDRAERAEREKQQALERARKAELQADKAEALARNAALEQKRQQLQAAATDSESDGSALDTGHNDWTSSSDSDVELNDDDERARELQSRPQPTKLHSRSLKNATRESGAQAQKVFNKSMPSSWASMDFSSDEN